jgi:hypothetical protein
MRQRSKLGFRSANRRPIDSASGCGKRESKRLTEGRHGHPSKLRGEVRTFLEETCRQAPSTPSHEIQTQLAERFALRISVSQINRVRAAARESAIHPNLRKKTATHDRARVAGRGRRVIVAGCRPRNQPPLPVGSSPTDQATQLTHVSALTSPSLPPATEPLAHALVSASGRTPPVLGFAQLYWARTRFVDGTTTALQLSSYRTLSADADYRPSRSSPDRSLGAVDSSRVADRGEESRRLLLFLRGWASETGLHRSLDSSRLDWTTWQNCGLPCVGVAAR